jgi:hypothetical protein
MADADKRNVIRSSHNTGWHRSVRPTLGAKDLRTEKNEPEVPGAVSETRSNRRTLLFGIVGFVIVWFSQASVLMMAGLGFGLALDWS